MLYKKDFYINGEWVMPEVANDLEVINPSDETVCATISLGGQGDTDKAVQAAREAFPAWSETPLSERVALLQRIADIYKARKDEMARAISTEMGAPIDLANAQQTGAGSWHMQGFLKAIETFEFAKPLGEHAPGEQILMEPIGVVALITPWNWPMNQIVLKAFPALAAGCTMILKPSEIAPLSGHLFAEFVHEAGCPKGVFNLVNGDGPGVGSQLSAHPDVDMVSFTGSTRAGIAISKSAANSLKRVSLELGGKGANIIFADASEKDIEYGVIRCFRNSGQSCNAPTRMLVERPLYQRAVEIVTKVAKQTEVGPASRPGGHIGPVVSQAQYDKIQGLIEAGMAEGCNLVAGGPGRPAGYEQGYYVKPTVFTDVNNQQVVAREEIFGPVLSLIPFDTEEEAIKIANDTEYGLTNYIQTPDVEKRRRVARRLRSGMVEMNSKGFGMGSPFGGYKKSGNGREGGRFGIEEFMEIKAVSDWG